MKTIRTTLAVALIGLAMTAFQSDALAQARRTGSGSSTSRSTSTSVSRSTASKATKTNTSVSRSSGVKPASRPAVSNTTDRKPGRTTVAKPSTTVSKPATQPTRPTTVTKPTTVTRPTTVTKPTQSTKPTTVTRPATGNKPTATRPATKPVSKPDVRPGGQNKPVTVTRPGHRPGDRKPVSGPGHNPAPPVQIRPDHKPDVHRVHPRDRDFMHYSTPSYFWTSHNHCYGHRVRVLPTHVVHHVYHGVSYYCYNDIWYRPYGGYYVVCRPPFGTVLAANLIADMTWAAINFSYYNNVAQSVNTHTDQLGLVQSYAAADSVYYYQDGVFYMMDENGQYIVIVPPAGALVETLPEDYDMVTLADGNEYYKVDDTVYKITISDGKPYFEVLGQLYM